MKKTIFFSVVFAMLVTLLMLFLVDSVFAEEEVTQDISSVSLTLLPAQERIPKANEPAITRELFAPPVGSSPSADYSPFSAPLISGLESGKWYVQIGAYKRAGHVEEAISRIGTSSPVVIHNAGTDTNPMFRVLLGPFSRNESKSILQHFKNNGYEAFERNGNQINAPR